MDNLKSKAIDIKGKKYVLVSDRVLHFNENFINGSIKTQLLSEPDATTIVIQAIVVPDHEEPLRYFTGLAQEVVGKGMVNTTSALENAETSAVGRALGMMGIGVIESIASADEMNKAINRQEQDFDNSLPTVNVDNVPKITTKQIAMIKGKATPEQIKTAESTYKKTLDNFSIAEASQMIKQLTE